MSSVPPLETAVKHTPGPWKSAPFRVVIQTAHGPVEGPLMSYLTGNKHTAQGMTVSIASEREADHHLCAAAPTLLEAAERALALIEKGAPGWGVAKDLLRAAIHEAHGK